MRANGSTCHGEIYERIERVTDAAPGAIDGRQFSADWPECIGNISPMIAT
jgi:hypothetical protein